MHTAMLSLFCLMLISTSVLGGMVMHPGYDYAAIKEKFQGPVLPVLTNYHYSNLSVNVEAIESNLETVISRGLVTGDATILTGAAGGDFPRLSMAQRKQVIDATIKAVKGRAPVICCIQHSNVDDIMELARYSEETGCDAVQVSAPYYYPSSLEDFNRTIAFIHEVTKNIPILVYNTPWEYNPPTNSAMDLSLEDIEYLANTWPRFLLLKWATNGDVHKYQKVISSLKSRLAIIDNTDIFPTTYMLGGTGFISHFANIWPEWNVKVHRMLKASQYKEAEAEIERAYWPWVEFFSKICTTTSGEGGPGKGALDLLEGRFGGPVAKPSRVLNNEESAELLAILQKIGVPGLKKQAKSTMMI